MDQAPPVTGWIAKPGPVVLAEVLCYVLAAILSLPVLWLVSEAIDPQEGVPRLTALAWSAAGLAAMAGLTLIARAISMRRRWGWNAVAVFGAIVLLGGMALIVVLLVAMARMVGEPVVGSNIGLGLAMMALTAACFACLACIRILRGIATPEARRWFGADAASRMP